MAERIVIDCDKCGKECQEHINISIPNGTHRYNDGVENNIDFLYEKKDLCMVCAEEMLRFMFRHTKRHDSPELYIIKSHEHSGPNKNEAVKLALKYFGIKEKT